jgi:hypothetical protein
MDSEFSIISSPETFTRQLRRAQGQEREQEREREQEQGFTLAQIQEIITRLCTVMEKTFQPSHRYNELERIYLYCRSLEKGLGRTIGS